MEEKLKNEYFKLLNLYKYTSSKPIREQIYSSLLGIRDTCEEYGINIPKISDILLVDDQISEFAEMDETSYDFIKNLSDEINKKILFQDYNVYNRVNSKLNRKKYDLITSYYLYYNKKVLYDLYFKMMDENRFFEINTGFDENDFNFFTIPYSHKDGDIIVIDGYTSLSFYTALIHELAHVDFDENYKFYGKYSHDDVANNLIEVYPIYNELLYGEYLRECKYFDKNYAYLLSKNQLVYNDESVLDNYDIHFMGNVLALNFFDMYLKDKEKANYNINEFLKNYRGNDFKTNINSYGLNEEKILSLKAIERDY